MLGNLCYRGLNRHMTQPPSKPQPVWKDAKAKLTRFDRTGLLGLVRDLYAAHKYNRTFLHARLGLIEDVLKSYKETIDRWLWPDVYWNQNTSVAKAKQAIFEYKKAVGEPAALADLMVFYCERAAGFCSEFGNDDETYLTALVGMFEQAIATAITLPADSQDALLTRLDQVRITGHELAYGVGDEMDSILTEYT
jgi:hypothetical protein